MGYLQWGAAAEKIAIKPKHLWPQPTGLDLGAVGCVSGEFPYRLSGLLESRADRRRHGADPLERQPSAPRADPRGGRRRGHRGGQIAKMLGIETYGTSSSDEKLERVKKLGLDYADQLSRGRLRAADEGTDQGRRRGCGFRDAGRRAHRQEPALLPALWTGHHLRNGHRTSGNNSTPGIMMAQSLSAHGLWLSVLGERLRADHPLPWPPCSHGSRGQASSSRSAIPCPWNRPARRIGLCWSERTMARSCCGSDKNLCSATRKESSRNLSSRMAGKRLLKRLVTVFWECWDYSCFFTLSMRMRKTASCQLSAVSHCQLQSGYSSPTFYPDSPSKPVLAF